MIEKADIGKDNAVQNLTIEIRAAEGGDDAKLFVGELARAYERLSESLG